MLLIDRINRALDLVRAGAGSVTVLPSLDHAHLGNTVFVRRKDVLKSDDDKNVYTKASMGSI